MKHTSCAMSRILVLFVGSVLFATLIPSRTHAGDHILPLIPGDAARAQTQLTDTVRLFGKIADSNGASPSQISVAIYPDSGSRLAQANTRDGFYEFSVPRLAGYWLLVTTWDDKSVYQINPYVPVKQEIRPENASEVRTDIILRPSGNLILNAYDLDGKMVRNANFTNLTGNHAYVTDLADQPAYGRFSAVQDTQSQSQGWSNDLAVPAFAVPIQTPSRMHVLWTVPDFGKIILDIDNEGRGYLVPDQGSYVVLNLNYEAAKSKLASLQRDYDAFVTAGYEISAPILSEIQSSTLHLRTAEEHLAQKPPDFQEAVQSLNLSLKTALWAHEALYLQKARVDTEQNRKGSVRIKVTDAEGKPLSKANVTFNQTTHDFLFSAGPMGKANGYDPRYANALRAAGFNSSQVMIPWGTIEPRPGQFDWNYIDRRQNIQVQLAKGFQLYTSQANWLNPGVAPNRVFCPQYLESMSFSELLTHSYGHMRMLGSRYRGVLGQWKFINEQNLRFSNCLNLTWDQKTDLINAVITGLKTGNPEAKILTNSGALSYEFNPTKLDNPSVRAEGVTYAEFLDFLIRRGVSFDGIGLEFYYAGVSGQVLPGLSLVSQSRLIDQYAGFGKPIHIIELSAPSVQYPGSGWWHRLWDETTQAEFVEQFYTIAFSKPLVQEIGWAYGVSDEDSFVKSGGLLDQNVKPKPAYYVLKNLISSWTTNGIGTTDENGELVIVGFAGDYDVTITTPSGQSQKSQVHVHERKDDSVALTAPGLAAVPTTTAVAPTTLLISEPPQPPEPMPVRAESDSGQIAWIIGAFVVVGSGFVIAFAIRKKTSRSNG